MSRIVFFLFLSLLTVSCKKNFGSSTKAKEDASAANSYAKASTGCGCQDTACWNEKIRGYQMEAGMCGMSAVLNATGIPGVGEVAGHVIGCAVEAGMTVVDLRSKIEECASLSRSKNASALIGCLGGSFAPGTSVFGSCLAGKSYEKFGAGLAILSCGTTVLKGSVVLSANTSCLLEDIQAAYKNAPNLDPRIPLPSSEHATANTCNGEEITCAMGVMNRYGRYLYKTMVEDSYFPTSTATLAKTCTQYCSNGGEARQECEKAMRANGFATMPGCEGFCAVAQCPNAINECISNCCHLDGDCTTEALRIIQAKAK